LGPNERGKKFREKKKKGETPPERLHPTKLDPFNPLKPQPKKGKKIEKRGKYKIPG